MIRNTNGLKLEGLLVLHGLSAEESKGVTELLKQECPWFGGADEVSEEIGVDMLADVLLVGAPRLVAWHNKNARGREEPDVEAANAAYESLVQAVSRFGVEDGFGSGDFWVMEDSFSGPCATVVAFGPLPLPADLKNALAGWLNRQSAMKKIVLVNRDGDVLFEFVRA